MGSSFEDIQGEDLSNLEDHLDEGRDGIAIDASKGSFPGPYGIEADYSSKPVIIEFERHYVLTYRHGRDLALAGQGPCPMGIRPEDVVVERKPKRQNSSAADSGRKKRPHSRFSAIRSLSID